MNTLFLFYFVYFICFQHIWIATVTAVEESPLYGVDGLDAYKGIYPSNPAPARLECTVLALVVRSCTSAPPCARPHSVRLWNSLIGWSYYILLICVLFKKSIQLFV